MLESAIAFECRGETLCGIVCEPVDVAPTVGLIVVVGGAQYRVGSHRHFVLLARAAAAAGVAALRFDVRGMGDASGPVRGFKDITPDIGAAIEAFARAVPSTRRFVLWGLCDGASAALLYLSDTRDRRVAALCLVNPWVRSEQSLARTYVRHYYLRRLLAGDFWRKLIRGGVGIAALTGLAGNVRSTLQRRPAGAGERRDALFQNLMARACAAFDGPLLLVLSGNDLTAVEFSNLAEGDPTWRQALHRTNVRCKPLPKADHTMSAQVDRLQHERDLVSWLNGTVMAT